MEKFEYFGCTYSINDDKETVSLVDATQAQGKFFIPSEVEYGSKSCSVTALKRREENKKKWVSDKRKKEGGFYQDDGKAYVSPFAKYGYPSYGDTTVLGRNNMITEVIIPDSVKELCSWAFYKTSLEEINIPTSVTIIPEGCFYECKKLNHVELHEGLTKIEKNAFAHCEALTEIEIPSSVKEIGYGAFYECKALTKVTIPPLVEKIDSNAFYRCSALSKITIPSSVKTIGESAFCGCNALTEITIPSSVKTIDYDAFCVFNKEGNYGEIVVNILNEEGAVIMHPKAFTDRTKINYLGKKKNDKPAAPKTDNAKEPAKGAAIDLEKLIKAALADGVVTDKERAILIKKVKETGGDTDEFEMLLDARIYEAQQKSGKATSKTEKKEPVEKITSPKKTKTETKPTSRPTGDYKKSAVSGGYTIGITAENKVVVSKGGAVCDNAKGALREISEKVGFKFETSWTTQQFGSKLVDFINNK